MTNNPPPLTDLREQLADLEHQQWNHWTAYFLANNTEENQKRWAKQALKIYSQLSFSEKESDRVYADKVLKILQSTLKSVLEEINKKMRLIGYENAAIEDSDEPLKKIDLRVLDFKEGTLKGMDKVKLIILSHFKDILPKEKKR